MINPRFYTKHWYLKVNRTHLYKGSATLESWHLQFPSAAGCILSRSLSTTQWSGLHDDDKGFTHKKQFSQTFSKLPWARLGYDLFVFHRWSSHNWENREKKVCWWILIPQLFLSKLIFFSQNFLVSGIPQNNTYLLNFQVSGTTTKWKKFSPQPFTSPF